MKAEGARDHLDARVDGLSEQLSVAWISAVSGCESQNIRPAQAWHQNPSCVRQHTDEFLQMFLSPLGHCVGEQRERSVAPGGVLHLQVDRTLVWGPLVRSEQQIDAAAAVFAIGHLGPDPSDRSQRVAEAPGLDGGFDQSVGEGCVDSNPAEAAIGARNFGLFPGPGQLSLR